MSKIKSELPYISTLIVMLTMIFLVAELCIWIGIIVPANDADGYFVNLAYGVEKALENPALWGIIMTLIVGAWSGYMENNTANGEQFDLKQLGETFFYYEPVLIVIAQFLPLKEAAIIVFAIDVLRRIALRIRGT